jgi:hypothetical protein
MLDPKSESEFGVDYTRRYTTVLDVGDQPTDAIVPACLLNEIPGEGSVVTTDDGGKPWYDPGNAGDTVSIAVTFNHPLITPLGLAPYIPLQARRSAVNEAFRVARATDALLSANPIGPRRNRPPVAIAKFFGEPENVTEKTYTFTTQQELYDIRFDGTSSYDRDGTIAKYEWYVDGVLYRSGAAEGMPTLQLTPGTHLIALIVTDNEGAVSREDTLRVTVSGPATNTPTNTPRPTATATPTTPPFSCDLITAGQLSFFGNRVFVQFQNDNVFDTVLTRVDLHWRRAAGYPNLAVVGMALDGIIHWSGNDENPGTDTNADVPTPSEVFLNADRTVYAQSTMTWEGVFGNPSNINLATVMTIYDFANTVFYFDNPTNGQPDPCPVPLVLPTPTPSPTFSANQPTNTATWTPDCASSQVSVRFLRWDTFGVMVLEVVNRRNTTAIMTDFSINWIQRSPGIMVLERVTVGGSGPADTVTPTTVVWDSGSASQDANPPTVGGSTSVTNGIREGNWRTNYTFPPNSVTPMYVDFGGTTTTLPTSFGVAPSDFNGTWFQIGCGANGGDGNGNGNGNGDSGRINLFNQNTPVPTNTPGPTVPPPPTFTPSRTWTPGPPTNTPRPSTPTSTPRASNTPIPPPPPTLPPSATPREQCGPDGECM